MREIKIICDHCGKDITCNAKTEICAHIHKYASAKDYAFGAQPFQTGDHIELHLCPNCYKNLDEIVRNYLKGRQANG